LHRNSAKTHVRRVLQLISQTGLSSVKCSRTNRALFDDFFPDERDLLHSPRTLVGDELLQHLYLQHVAIRSHVHRHETVPIRVRSTGCVVRKTSATSRTTRRRERTNSHPQQNEANNCATAACDSLLLQARPSIMIKVSS
jgi:hypothetical protein